MSNNFLRSIERKIKDTNEEIKNINDSNMDRNVKTLLIAQLNERKKNLEEQKSKMDELYAKEQIKLIISGEQIGKGEVPIRVLGETLCNIQNMIDCIANSVKNQQNKNKRINKDIKESTQFILKEVFEGSFGMIIEAPFTPDMVDNDNITTNTCKKMFDLLSYENNEEKLKVAAKELGYKTMNSYRELLKKIHNSNANLRFEWNSNSGEKNIWKSNKDRVKETINKINTIKIEEEELIQKKGKLTKIDIIKEQFTIITEEEIINGKTNFEILMGMRNILNKEKEFYLTKKTYYHINTGKEKIEWILTGYNKES